MRCDRCGAEGAVSMAGGWDAETDQEVEYGPWLCVGCMTSMAPQTGGERGEVRRPVARAKRKSARAARRRNRR